MRGQSPAIAVDEELLDVDDAVCVDGAKRALDELSVMKACS